MGLSPDYDLLSPVHNNVASFVPGDSQQFCRALSFCSGSCPSHIRGGRLDGPVPFTCIRGRLRSAQPPVSKSAPRPAMLVTASVTCCSVVAPLRYRAHGCRGERCGHLRDGRLDLPFTCTRGGLRSAPPFASAVLFFSDSMQRPRTTDYCSQIRCCGAKCSERHGAQCGE